MNRRICITISDDLVKLLRKKQSKLQKDSLIAVSFSSVLCACARKGVSMN